MGHPKLWDFSGRRKGWATRLLDTALRQDVAFVPGDPFYPGGDTGSHMRLNFSNAQPDQIREGIRRLSIAVAHELEHVEVSATV